MRRISLPLLTLLSLIALSSCSKNLPPPLDNPTRRDSPRISKRPAQTLDLSTHYTEQYDAPNPEKASPSGITGKRKFDGVPFLVNGSAILFGNQLAEDAGKSRNDYPDIIGVKVGRTFDELHLLHTTKWPDVEGMTIARVRMNYADGTMKELNLGYGVHVRDWQRLQSEEREALTSPQAKTVWRGPGMEKFKSSQRMFKSMLKNPNKAKKVDTIDFLSAGQIASYCLHAATVTDADSDRTVSPTAPLDRPEWKFDGKITVRLLDLNGNPIQNALVDTSLSVPDTSWATSGAPFYSSAEGTGIVKHPKDRTNIIILKVTKKGWKSVSKQINLKEGDAALKNGEITFRMSPEA